MRRRAIAMTTTAVAVAVLFLGLPGLIFGGVFVWQEAHNQLATRAGAVGSMVERFVAQDVVIGDGMLETLSSNRGGSDFYIEVDYPDGETISSPVVPDGELISESVVTASGVMVTVSSARSDALLRVGLIVVGALALVVGAFLIGVLVAMRQSRRLSAPLIYLAATAEQIGAGQVRPQIRESGIEEIDLVYQELQRTADRMAGRLAAERQFAADAAHQLRTPLAALSMRIEEIEYLTEDEEILEEVNQSLEQIDRLGGVVDELMKTSQSQSGGTTEAISVQDIFDQQNKEWARSFRKAGRSLSFESTVHGSVLATPGSIAQILATLIENSLKYGDGTTRVTAAPAGKMVLIKVVDEGKGVPDDLGDDIFLKGVSASGSTGIGLAVAKELAATDGGRLELTQKRPAEFTLTVSAVPQSLDPERVLPPGALHSAGSRRGRR